MGAEHNLIASITIDNNPNNIALYLDKYKMNRTGNNINISKQVDRILMNHLQEPLPAGSDIIARVLINDGCGRTFLQHH